MIHYPTMQDPSINYQNKLKQLFLWILHNLTPATHALRNHVHVSKEIMRGLHKLIFSTNKMVIRNGKYNGGNKLCSVLSDFCFKGKEWNSIWIIQWTLFTFR